MLAPVQASRALRPLLAISIISTIVLGFYLGLLFFLGFMAALVLAIFFFKGKFRLMVGFGGGFSGLATWFTVMLNHKEQYDRVVAFLAQYLSENWAAFLCDATLCSFGALVFVSALGGTHRGTKKMVSMLRSRGVSHSTVEEETTEEGS